MLIGIGMGPCCRCESLTVVFIDAGFVGARNWKCRKFKCREALIFKSSEFDAMAINGPYNGMQLMRNESTSDSLMAMLGGGSPHVGLQGR